MAITNDIRRENPVNAIAIGGLAVASWRRLWLVVVIVLALAVPYMVEDFTTFQFSLALIYAIAILGLNLLTGFNGQFSLGHSAFYGIGAYVTAMMMFHYDWAWYWAMIPAGVAAFVFGFLFGLPALRLEGLYLALATFALAVALPQILKYEPLQDATGGVQGLNIERPESPFCAVYDGNFCDEYLINDDQWIYYIVLMFTAAAFLLAWNITRGRPGRAMLAIRDNPIAARTMGINTSLYKSLTFGVSSLFTGIAGSLAAIAIEYVAPESFTFILAVTLLIGLVLGGVASIPGCVFGGLFILFVPNVAEEIHTGLTWAIYGAFLILAVYVMPSGAAGLVRIVTMRLIHRARTRALGLMANAGE